MRSASAGLRGLPRISLSTTTTVSAPRTKSVGRCLKMAQAFSRARRSAKMLAASPSSGTSGMLVGCTVIAMPAARSNSWRRGEAEARIRAMDGILKETKVALLSPRVRRHQVVGAIVDHQLAIMLGAVLDGKRPDGGVVGHPVAEEFGGIVQACVALLLNHFRAVGDGFLHELDDVGFGFESIAGGIVTLTEVGPEV